MAGDDAARLPSLPIRPRSAAGEPASSYVRRLAAANHLRPSYLHSILRDPFPGGAIRPERLAALSGRAAETLKRTLAGLDGTPTRLPGAALVFLHNPISAWTTQDPGISARKIWERLIDEHEAEISYPAIIGYLRRHAPRRPGKTD